MPDDETKTETTEQQTTDPESGGDIPDFSNLPPDEIAALLELHNAAKSANMTAAQIHDAAYRYTMMKQQEEARMFAEREAEKHNGDDARPQETEPETTDDGYVTLAQARQMAADIAARMINEANQQLLTRQQLATLHAQLAQQHGITDPVMQEAARLYAEANSKMMTPPIAYAQFAAANKTKQQADRVAAAVKSSAAVRPAGTASGSTGGPVIPKDTSKEPSDNRIQANDAQKFSYRDAMAKLFNGVRV